MLPGAGPPGSVGVRSLAGSAAARAVARDAGVARGVVTTGDAALTWAVTRGWGATGARGVIGAWSGTDAWGGTGAWGETACAAVPTRGDVAGRAATFAEMPAASRGGGVCRPAATGPAGAGTVRGGCGASGSARTVVGPVLDRGAGVTRGVAVAPAFRSGAGATAGLCAGLCRGVAAAGGCACGRGVSAARGSRSGPACAAGDPGARGDGSAAIAVDAWNAADSSTQASTTRPHHSQWLRRSADASGTTCLPSESSRRPPGRDSIVRIYRDRGQKSIHGGGSEARRARDRFALDFPQVLHMCSRGEKPSISRLSRISSTGWGIKENLITG